MKLSSRIFIAGHRGLVGSAILRKLKAYGYNNLITRTHKELDLCRQGEVESFFKNEKPEYVFLAAARVGGIHANNTYPADFIYSNLCIQNNVIHSAYLNKVNRLLFLGSSCIYPKECPQPMKEEHLLSGYLEPTNEPYAIAKIAGIKMCESYNRQFGTKFIAVMPTNLYGPGDNFDLMKSHVLPAMIRKFHLAKLAQDGDFEGVKKDEARFGIIPEDIKIALGLNKSSRPSAPCTIPIWGTGTPRREFLHVNDMADACIYLINLDDETIIKNLLSYPKPCFVNLGSGMDCTIRELAEIIRDVAGFEGDIVYDRSKPDGTLQKLLDVSRLKKLGWAYSITLRKGIADTYKWYLDENRF